MFNSVYYDLLYIMVVTDCYLILILLFFLANPCFGICDFSWTVFTRAYNDF